MNVPVKFAVCIDLTVPEIIWGSLELWLVPIYPLAPFSQIFLMGFCLDGPCYFTGQRRSNLQSVALTVAEIIGGTLKFWLVPGYAHASFSPKFLMGFCSDGPCE